MKRLHGIDIKDYTDYLSNEPIKIQICILVIVLFLYNDFRLRSKG